MTPLVQIIRDSNLFAGEGRPVFCTIGMFDGLHLGHQFVVNKTVERARKEHGVALAISFEQHPALIVAPERAPRMIYPLYKRQELLEASGMDCLWLIPFDIEFSRITGPEFLARVLEDFKPVRQITVGNDFHFGFQRTGNKALLQREAIRGNFDVPTVTPVAHQENEVSSTVIRQLIQTGAITDASARLGRSYAICGPVVKGRQLGRQLGFPTANIDTDSLVLPPNGVYAVYVTAEGKQHEGVMNIGLRPTHEKATPHPTVEVHLFDFKQDLYDTRIEVQPLQRLRDERKFDSLDELRKQITLDCERARDYFASMTQS